MQAYASPQSAIGNSSLLAEINLFTIMTLWMIILGIGIVDCTNEAISDCMDKTKMSSKPIEEALEEHTNELMSLSDVIGTGQGLCDDKPCIKVFVIKKNHEMEERISKILHDFPFKIEETGRIKAR